MKSLDYKEIAKRLKARRTALGMTYQELADSDSVCEGSNPSPAAKKKTPGKSYISRLSGCFAIPHFIAAKSHHVQFIAVFEGLCVENRVENFWLTSARSYPCTGPAPASSEGPAGRNAPGPPAFPSDEPCCHCRSCRTLWRCPGDPYRG